METNPITNKLSGFSLEVYENLIGNNWYSKDYLKLIDSE